MEQDIRLGIKGLNVLRFVLFDTYELPPLCFLNTQQVVLERIVLQHSAKVTSVSTVIRTEVISSDARVSTTTTAEYGA